MFRVFRKILRQAFALTKGYKIFWLSGLFLVWFTLLRSGLFLSLFYNELPFAQDMLLTGSAEPAAGNAWWGALSFIVIFMLIVQYFRSKAVVALAAKELKEKRIVQAKEIHAQARNFFRPLFNSSFVLSFILLLMTIFIVSPIVYLAGGGYAGRAYTLSFLGVIIYAPIFIFLYYSLIFSSLFIVSFDFSFRKAMFGSWALIREMWPALVIFSLVLLGVELVGLAVSVLAAVLVAFPFVIFLQLFYDNVGSGTVNVLVSLAGVTGFVVFFLSQARIAGFVRLAWTLLFFELIKPIKDEEKVEEAVPEVAN